MRFPVLQLIYCLEGKARMTTRYPWRSPFQPASDCFACLRSHYCNDPSQYSTFVAIWTEYAEVLRRITLACHTAWFSHSRPFQLPRPICRGANMLTAAASIFPSPPHWAYVLPPRRHARDNGTLARRAYDSQSVHPHRRFSNDKCWRVQIARRACANIHAGSWLMPSSLSTPFSIRSV